MASLHGFPLASKVAWILCIYTSGYCQSSRAIAREPAGRVLLFVTTHLTPLHLRFLETCWPSATRASPFIQSADVLVFVTGELDDAKRRVLDIAFPPWTNRSIIHTTLPNAGYNRGAMDALAQADAHGWFWNYDWVVRLNADVIIRDDRFLSAIVARHDVDAVFVDCYAGQQPDKVHIQTDFIMFRPNKVARGSFRIPKKWSPAYCGEQREYWTLQKDMSVCEPEHVASHALESIIRSKRWALLPGVRILVPHCRVRGETSPVVHDHAYVDQCVSNAGSPHDVASAVAADVLQCNEWRMMHKAMPGTALDALPAGLRKNWTARNCDDLMHAPENPEKNGRKRRRRRY